MKVEIMGTQEWAITGGIKIAPVDYDRGFYMFETGFLDAPSFLPSGHTIKNDRGDEGVYVIGGVVASPNLH